MYSFKYFMEISILALYFMPSCYSDIVYTVLEKLIETLSNQLLVLSGKNFKDESSLSERFEKI